MDFLKINRYGKLGEGKFALLSEMALKFKNIWFSKLDPDHKDLGKHLQSYSDLLEKSGSYKDLITYVKDRPGHDRRYAINANKVRQEVGFCPTESFESGIKKTINFYFKNL